jgi:hypothetical protein
MASMGAPQGLGHLLKVLVVDLAAGTPEVEIPVLIPLILSDTSCNDYSKF